MATTRCGAFPFLLFAPRTVLPSTAIAIKDLAARADLGLEQIDHFVPHPPNGVLLTELIERAGLASDGEAAIVTEQMRLAGVVGCGVMGSGIAEVCARACLKVRVAVRSQASIAAGRARLLRSLDRALAQSKITEAERSRALERVSFGIGLGELADCQIIFEAIPETDHPERVIGTHFFSPVPALPLMELIGSLPTEPIYIVSHSLSATTPLCFPGAASCWLSAWSGLGMLAVYAATAMVLGALVLAWRDA